MNCQYFSFFERFLLIIFCLLTSLYHFSTLLQVLYFLDHSVRKAQVLVSWIFICPFFPYFMLFFEKKIPNPCNFLNNFWFFKLKKVLSNLGRQEYLMQALALKLWPHPPCPSCLPCPPCPSYLTCPLCPWCVPWCVHHVN